MGLAPIVPAAAGTVAGATIRERDGRLLRLSDYRGRWVLINYWATWCGDCIEELPALSRMATDPRLQVIGLSDERIALHAWTAFLHAHPVGYPVALVDLASLPASIPPSAWLLSMRPISYLIAPDGRVARRFIGTVSPAGLDQAMAHAGG